MLLILSLKSDSSGQGLRRLLARSVIYLRGGNPSPLTAASCNQSNIESRASPCSAEFKRSLQKGTESQVLYLPSSLTLICLSTWHLRRLHEPSQVITPTRWSTPAFLLSPPANPLCCNCPKRQLTKPSTDSKSPFSSTSHLYPTLQALLSIAMAPAATGEMAPMHLPAGSLKPLTINASVLHGPRDLRLVSPSR